MPRSLWKKERRHADSRITQRRPSPPSTGWSRSPGMGGRDQSERLVAINRNSWSRSSGARSRTPKSWMMCASRTSRTTRRSSSRLRRMTKRTTNKRGIMERMPDPSQDLLHWAGKRKFSTVLADPPWRFQNSTGKIAPEHRRLSRYGTLSLEEIKSLSLSSIVTEPAHLYLWVPNALLAEGLELWLPGASRTNRTSCGTRSEKTAQNGSRCRKNGPLPIPAPSRRVSSATFSEVHRYHREMGVWAGSLGLIF